MHPDDAFKCGGLFEPFAQIEASGAGFEYRMRHVDGTWRWHISRCQPILDESGTVTGFEGIATDITERKSEEDALFENQSNLRTVLDGVDGSICFLDRTGTILEANRNFVLRLGKSMEDCLGHNAFTLFQPELARTRGQFLDQVFETGDPVTFEDQRQDRWIRQTLTPVKGSSGKVIRVVVYATDVTEQKKIMEDLRVSAALFGTLFQVLPMGITVTDEAGKIVDSNSLALKLLGVSRKEHTKRTIDGQEWRIVRKNGSPMPACEFASTKALKEKRLVENVEMGIIKEPDVITWINVSACPIPIDGYGVVVSYNDISERIHAEKMVASLLKEKDLVLRETHHRIKNNMGTIVSLLSLQAHGQKDENVSNILNDAAGRVKSMMVLYESLYDSSNYCDLSISNFLKPLVESIMGLFSNIHAVRAEVKVDDFMLGSKILTSLGIIINELITNSMKYAFGDTDDGMIRISATKTGSSVMLIYEDNGPGLPVSVDLENSGGFGMQLLKMLVQQIGGSMRLEKSGGARFVIEFTA
jgi:PAS domain S-box-containing protein